MSRTFLLAPLLSALLGAAQTRAQPPATAQSWAKRAAEHQIQDLIVNTNFLRYQVHSKDTKGDLVRDLIESTDGPVARLIFKDGRPLTPQEDLAERERLQAMLDDPAAFARHTRSDRSLKKQAAEVVSLIPHAMLFTYDPKQPPHQILLDFHPDPAWQPPTMASQLLTGLEGRVWIDPESGHLTRLETTVFRSVNVGFGIFARLFPGGTVAVDQVPAPLDRWLVSHFIEHLTLRALMIKTYKENAEVQVSNATAVEPLTYSKAIARLLATPVPTAP